MASELGSPEISRGQMASIKFNNLVDLTSPTVIFGQILIMLPRSAFIYLHIACSNFAGLFIVRFLLGIAEACVVPSFVLILSMFFTYDEQAVLMPCMWAIGNSSPITSGLLSYGVLFIKTGDFAPWKWFMGKFL